MPQAPPILDARARATTNQCIVCAGDASEPLYAGLRRCRTCGHIFADLRLTDDELRALYGAHYFAGGEYSDYTGDEAWLRRNFMLRLATLKRFLSPYRHHRLLEIGCAYGFFLDAARPLFTSVAGIDITEAGVAHARAAYSLEVQCAEFLAHDFGDRRFDVVCLWDTIEHLRDPHRYLQKIASLTAEGALVALTTGDIKSLNARLRGPRWRLIHPPTHLHYFSTETIARLLDNYGFEIVYQRHCGFYRSFGNMLSGLLARHSAGRWLTGVLDGRLAHVGFYLNFYDIMYVIARRREAFAVKERSRADG